MAMTPTEHENIQMFWIGKEIMVGALHIHNSWPPLFSPLPLSLSPPPPPPQPPQPPLLIFTLPLRPIAHSSSFPKLHHHYYSLHSPTSSFAKLTTTNPTSPLPQPNLFLQHQPFCPPKLPMALLLHQTTHKTLSLIPYLICFASQLATAMPSS